MSRDSSCSSEILSQKIISFNFDALYVRKKACKWILFRLTELSIETLNSFEFDGTTWITAGRFFFFQLSFIKVRIWQVRNIKFCSNDFNTEVIHERSPDDFQTINFERRRRNFRKEKYPIIRATRRLTSLKYLERTTWMRYVFRTGPSCLSNSLWEIIMKRKAL